MSKDIVFDIKTEQKAYEICLEMLSQRMYKLIKTISKYILMFQNEKDGEHIIVVFHFLVSKLSTKCIKDIINIMNEINVKHAIVIYKNDVTSATKNTIHKLMLYKHIELFCEKELQFNITKHRLQPKFEKLNKKDALMFKEKYGSKFSKLRKDKPISKFYNYNKGDVIRVSRKNGDISYRIVI